MMSCLSSAVSGLKSHQKKMDVISNNISNVNTIGFKSARVNFSDVLSQTMRGASSPNSSTGKGGTNPMQLGLGVSVSAVDTMTTAGSLESTGNITDLAIEGTGFFIVRSGSSGSYCFTRAGSFSLDSSGNLVNSDGMNVYGWLEYEAMDDGTYEFNTDNAVEPINIYTDSYNGNKKTMAAKATEKAEFSGNLDASETAVGTALSTIDTTGLDPHYTTTFSVVDSLGEEQDVTLNYYKCYVDSTTDPDSPVTSWYWEATDSAGTSLGNGFIEFDSSGDIVTTDSTNFNVNPEITIDMANGADDIDLTLDFTNLNMSSDDSSVAAEDVSGYVAGSLEDMTVDSDGVIWGIYSNDEQMPLGKVALATFNNPAGLTKVGSNLYIASANSGDFENGVAAGTGGAGTLSVGYLESSNVDLSQELSDMIITQRGYQANSRVITTADEMLQELVNLKR